MSKDYKIIGCYGHYEVRNGNGDFICSTDNYSEAMDEIMERKIFDREEKANENLQCISSV